MTVIMFKPVGVITSQPLTASIVSQVVPTSKSEDRVLSNQLTRAKLKRNSTCDVASFRLGKFCGDKEFLF